MEILVCIKQVPATTEVEVDPVTGVLKREGSATKVNPYDLFALEEAFQLKEKYGGQVTVLSMGPDPAKAVLLEALYMGADKGCLLSDRNFAGADVVATSYTLASGIRKLGEFDLIICGKQTTDGDTAQVGPETAEFLGIPHASYVEELYRQDDTTLEVTVNMGNYRIRQRMSMPCLVTIEQDVNTPRLPSFRRRSIVGPKDIVTYSLKDFDDQDLNNYGLKGSPTQVEKIFPPEHKQERVMITGTSQQVAEELEQLLSGYKFI